METISVSPRCLLYALIVLLVLLNTTRVVYYYAAEPAQQIASVLAQQRSEEASAEAKEKDNSLADIVEDGVIAGTETETVPPWLIGNIVVSSSRKEAPPALLRARCFELLSVSALYYFKGVHFSFISSNGKALVATGTKDKGWWKQLKDTHQERWKSTKQGNIASILRTLDLPALAEKWEEMKCTDVNLRTTLPNTHIVQNFKVSLRR